MSRSPLVVERVLPAIPSVVFEHWSNPESLAEWMRPGEGMKRASVTVDFRVGGRFEIIMHGDTDLPHWGEYVEIERDRRLVFTWVSEWAPEAERHTLVTISLEPVGDDATRLLIVHEVPDSDVYAGHGSGWERILRGLGDAVA